MQKYSRLKAVIIYILAAIIFTWPLLPNITTHFPSTFSGVGGDPDMYIWFMDLAAKKVSNFDFQASKMVFYPDGINLLAGYEGVIVLALGTPIILLTHNPILAYNLILLLAFILTCFICYLLIYYLTGSFFSALIAGFSFGLSPYMLVRGVQHLDLLFLFTLPLVAFLAFKFIDNPTKKNILFLALSVFLTALCAWYYLVGSLIFLLILFLFNLSKFKLAKKQYFFAAIAVGLAVFLPAFFMFVNKSSSAFKYVSYLVETRGASPLNFFVPHFYMWSFTQNIYAKFISPYESTSYFGLVGLIAIFTLIFLSKKIIIPRRNFWITAIIIFVLISFGNSLEIFHHKIPMMFRFLREFMPFNRLRAPNRFFVFAYLGTTVIFGYFLAYARSYIKQYRWKILLTSLLMILLVSERLIFPYPIMSLKVPNFYYALGSDKEKYAIADIPFINPGISLYNYYQIYHKKPIVDGEYFWTAYNAKIFNFIKTSPLLINSVPCDLNASINGIDIDQTLKHLSNNNIRYVVVHNLILNSLSCPELTSFIHNFFKNQKIVFSDGEITVYSTTFHKIY